jgi:hypothetical protein
MSCQPSCYHGALPFRLDLSGYCLFVNMHTLSFPCHYSCCDAYHRLPYLLRSSLSLVISPRDLVTSPTSSWDSRCIREQVSLCLRLSVLLRSVLLGVCFSGCLRWLFVSPVVFRFLRCGFNSAIVRVAVLASLPLSVVV